MSIKKYKTIAALLVIFCSISCEYAKSMQQIAGKKRPELKTITCRNADGSTECYTVNAGKVYGPDGCRLARSTRRVYLIPPQAPQTPLDSVTTSAVVPTSGEHDGALLPFQSQAQHPYQSLQPSRPHQLFPSIFDLDEESRGGLFPLPI
ncbi:MAG: hypothetical protein LBE95_01515 [Holosporaceae bacterium]|jgi:hypothetical protein|nr:hypothetical protein [Holosporaceae bacterium]